MNQLASSYNKTSSTFTYCSNIYSFTSTGKERDAETGYYYHGARFNSSDWGWLSVDPMADKYPSMSPYAYCAWNPIKLVDPEGMEFDPTMEKYSSLVELYCDRKIKKLSEMESLTPEQESQLSEFKSAKKEIQKMRQDTSTYYGMQTALFRDKDTKGTTQYVGHGDITCIGKEKHWIMVSLNIEDGLFTENGELNMKGLGVFVHELKHCYQFYNKETLYVQPADGIGFKDYNTKTLEKAAFKRGTAFGSFSTFNSDNYPDLSIGTMDNFINKYPGCQIFKHQ